MGKHIYKVGKYRMIKRSMGLLKKFESSTKTINGTVKINNKRIGICKIDITNENPTWYITGIYDSNSWDAEWVIDSPNIYYNICYAFPVKLDKKIIKGCYINNTGGFEDKEKYVDLSIMLNVE